MRTQKSLRISHEGSLHSSNPRDTADSRTFLDDVPSIYSEDLRQEESKFPEDNTSVISSGTARKKYAKFTFAAVAVVVFFIVGAGIGIGFGIGFARRPHETTPDASSNGNLTNSTGSDDDEKNKGQTNNSTRITWLDSKDYFLFGGVEMAATKEAIDRDACFEFCVPYDAVQFLYVQDLCSCYNEVSCLMEWGPKVDSTKYQFFGDLYTKQDLDVCPQDYCQELNDQSGLCFTANSQDYQDYSLHGSNIFEKESQTVETLDECLDLCAPYEAASFLNWNDCKCYDRVDCWLEWGDSVDTQFLFGLVYSKKPLDVCLDSTYCQINDDGRCFTANVQDSKQYTVFGTSLVEHNSTLVVSSEEECLEQCAPYDAASFRRPNICACYENPSCWLEWGDNVDTQLFFGGVYSKTHLNFCELDYCQANPQDSLCFTNNEEDYRVYSLYGDSMVEMVSNQTENLQACLDLCAPYDAASFLNFSNCTCYNSTECLLPWGDQVDSDNFFGTVYSKQALEECSQDYCQAIENATDGICFTGNSMAYSRYSLFGNSLEDVTSTNDLNSEEECLDFCKEYDAAQFLNFQDPKCACYNGADCWLAWPENQTETKNSGLYTGNVYSKKELHFCSFDYCSQFSDGELCVVGNNRE